MRCEECGGVDVHHAAECTQRYVAPEPEPRVELPPPPPPFKQGEWVSHRHTIGDGEAAETITSPALVLGVREGVVRLACFVAEAGRVQIIDTPAYLVDPPVDALDEGEPDGD